MEWNAISTIAAAIAALAAIGAFAVNLATEIRVRGGSFGSLKVAIIARWREAAIFILATLLAVALYHYRPRRMTDNEQLTKNAWDALNTGSFTLATTSAEQCITKYLGEANSKEESLESSGRRQLGGKVSEAEKNAILERGELNDVATSFFIKGLAAEQLGNPQGAIDSYRNATRYKYALTYEPAKDLFWSPAEAAKANLALLEKAKEISKGGAKK